MTLDEAEKAYMKQVDDSMGVIQRNDWYKRRTVRKAFINGWKQAMEAMKVESCVKANVRQGSVCSKKGCNEPVYEFGYCIKHYCISDENVC